MPETAGVIDALDRYVAEALRLRFDAEPVKQAATPAMLLEALMDVRQRLDRVEELLGNALRIRGRARRAADHAHAVYTDAFDEATHTARQDYTREEYTTGKEREAEANLAALKELRAARAAAETAHGCDEAVDVLRLTYRGLESARQDLLAAMRLFQFESSLDR